jgi:hypothetical protein
VGALSSAKANVGKKAIPNNKDLKAVFMFSPCINPYAGYTN